MHRSPPKDAPALLCNEHLSGEMKEVLRVYEDNYKRVKDLEMIAWDKASKFFCNSWSACHEQLKQFLQEFHKDVSLARQRQSQENNINRAKEILNDGNLTAELRTELVRVCTSIETLGELENIEELLQKVNTILVTQLSTTHAEWIYTIYLRVLMAVSATREQTEVSNRKVTANSGSTPCSDHCCLRCRSEASSTTDGTSPSGSVSRPASPGEIRRILDGGNEELQNLEIVRNETRRFIIESWEVCGSHLQEFTRSFQENAALIKEAKVLQGNWKRLQSWANTVRKATRLSQPHTEALLALLRRCNNMIEEAQQLQSRHERIRELFYILNRILGNTPQEIAAWLWELSAVIAPQKPANRSASTASVNPAKRGSPATAARSNSSTAARRKIATVARRDSSTAARGNFSTNARGGSSTAARRDSTTAARRDSTTAARGNFSTAARGDSSTAVRGYSAAGVRESSSSRTSGTKRTASAITVRDARTTTSSQSLRKEPWDADLRRFAHPRAQGDEATAAKRRR